MDVALIQWPEEEKRRLSLAARSQPRLLLVAGTADPPTSGDLLEDWVRLPATDRDVRARVRCLEMRIRRHVPPAPDLSSHGILRHGSDSVALSPLQARLAAALVANMGTVVARDQLIRAGWPEARPARNTVDVHVARLRSRLSTIGLALRTIRSRGFMLEVDHGRE